MKFFLQAWAIFTVVILLVCGVIGLAGAVIGFLLTILPAWIVFLLGTSGFAASMLCLVKRLGII